MQTRYSQILFAIIVILITNSLKAYAQQYIKLEECRELAIKNNKRLRIASEKERMAYYERKDAFTKYFPQLSFSGAYLRNQKNLRLIDPASIPSSITTPPITIPPVIELPSQTIDISQARQKILNATEIDIQNIWVMGFSMTQPIFTGGKIIAYNDLTKYAEELSKTMRETETRDVIIEVDQTYWQIVSLSHKNKLAQAYVNLLKKINSDVSMLEEEGLATKADRLSVNVKLNEAEMTLTKAANGLSLSKMLLAQICGLDSGESLLLEDENSKSLQISNEDTSQLPDQNNIFANRLEIKSLSLGEKIYEKKEKIVRSELMPSVALVGAYSLTNPSFFNGYNKRLEGMWSVGVGVSVPLNFVSSSYKLKIARAETQIKKLEMEEVKEKIILQVNQENYKLNEAIKKLEATSKNAERAEENLRYANAGFEEGVIAASDVLSAHTAWLAANMETLDAQIDAKLCKIYLNKAIGYNPGK